MPAKQHVDTERKEPRPRRNLHGVVDWSQSRQSWMVRTRTWRHAGRLKLPSPLSLVFLLLVPGHLFQASQAARHPLNFATLVCNLQGRTSRHFLVSSLKIECLRSSKVLVPFSKAHRHQMPPRTLRTKVQIYYQSRIRGNVGLTHENLQAMRLCRRFGHSHREAS